MSPAVNTGAQLSTHSSFLCKKQKLFLQYGMTTWKRAPHQPVLDMYSEQEILF